MTKPVQIQRYAHIGYQDDCEHQESDTGTWVLHAAHEAALLQVREMLEAKAAKWTNTETELQDSVREGHCIQVTAEYFKPIAEGTLMRYMAKELLALAATLGNQGK